LKGLLAILGKGKSSPDEGEDEAPASSPEGADMKASYRKEAMAAAKDGDLEGLASALMGFAECCSEEG
jgi:hypothetical protein